MFNDFIVIGSGLAGLTSALELEKYGLVLLISKNRLEDCATSLAQGGIAAVMSSDDNIDSHIKDTLIAGSYHNREEAVKFLVGNAPEAIDWLTRQGVLFDKINGDFARGMEAAHSFARILHATDFTGREVENALIKKVRESQNIEIWENTLATDLLIDKGCCLGVKVIRNAAHSQFLHHRGSPYMPATPEVSLPPRKIIDCFSRATILASGGLGQVYQWTTNPKVATGDGYALAYRAGAELKDMEFIQFHPTALKHGQSPLFLLSEALRGEGAYLTKLKIKNEKVKIKEMGERFMRSYDERMELAPRDIVACAIFNEQEKGYGVYLDIRHKGKEFLIRRFPNIYKELKSRGLDLSTDLIPVTPAAHYSCGGVEVDLYGRTNIRNLFAFGEVACTGVHGANRLASNSLLEAVVFPLRLKECISELPKRFPNSSFTPPVKTPGRWRNGLSCKELLPGESLSKIRKKLKQLMWEKVGIIRTRGELLEAKKKIIKLEEELKAVESPDREFLELKNMVQVSELIIKAALKRTKSLGAHFII